MPPPESTNSAGSLQENVQYIVKGSSPVFATLSVVTFILLLIAIGLIYLELTEVYDYGWAIFIAPQ